MHMGHELCILGIKAAVLCINLLPLGDGDIGNGFILF